MSKLAHPSSPIEAAVLTRLLRPHENDLSVEAAQALLRLEFDPEDLDRMHELVTKNQDDTLSPSERDELESYLRISSFLDLMRAKARHSIQPRC